VSEQQRQQWRKAIAANGKQKRGGRRYRQRRTGLGGISGAGRVRIRVVLPDVVGGQGDDAEDTEKGTAP
jgi:hypothetical protein